MSTTTTTTVQQQQQPSIKGQTFNPFYSHDPTSKEDPNYEFNHYKPSFPKVNWAPLELQEFEEKGFKADKSKKNLLGAATKVDHLEPAIGTELLGINLYELTDEQKDELALLAAERSVVILRNQPIDIHKQLDLGRYFGPLHKHATTPVPRQEGLEEVHVIYSDSSKRPDPSAYTKTDLYHSDVTYELQPPSTTILQVITAPEKGGSTIFSSGYYAYDSFSPNFQKYLESLYAIHSSYEQANGSRAAGTHVRREPISTVHPVVRVHPVTGWKSLFVQPGFTRSLLTKEGNDLVPLPKHESNSILNLLYRQVADQVDAQIKVRWNKGDIVVWDNRVTSHSAIFNTWPQTRHALRVTPHASDKPRSVEDHDALNLPSGKARSRQLQIWEEEGLTPYKHSADITKPKGYSD